MRLSVRGLTFLLLIAGGAANADDARPAEHSYLHRLGDNTLHVFSIPNVPVLLIGGAAAGAATTLDDDTVHYFEDHPAPTWADVGDAMGTAGVDAALIAGFFGAGRIAHPGRFRDFSDDMSQSFLIDTAYTFALKSITRRWRPDHSNQQSFPSGHASFAFTGASVVGHYYGAAGGIPAYALAVFIAGSRLPANKHYLSDVVAGSTLGFVVGRTVVHGHARRGEVGHGPSRTVGLMPDFGPSGGGTGARLVVIF
jgi:membrane-associated phospholipid phosphatase